MEEFGIKELSETQSRFTYPEISITKALTQNTLIWYSVALTPWLGQEFHHSLRLACTFCTKSNSHCTSQLQRIFNYLQLSLDILAITGTVSEFSELIKFHKSNAPTHPHPQMKIWTDLGIWELSWSGVPSPPANENLTLGIWVGMDPNPPPPPMKIWTDLGTWDLNWSGD